MMEVLKFLDEAGVYYLATTENNKAHVRPFGTANVYNGKLYIQTGATKDVAKQILKNPNVEICAFKDGKWLRVNGDLVKDDDLLAKRSMLNKYPHLKDRYSEDDPNTLVFYFKNATATFYSMTAKPKIVKF